MPEAILIAGNSLRFTDEIREFRGYLVTDAGIGRRRIRAFETAYAWEGWLESRLSRAVAERTKVPLLILYCGHGDKSGWALDDERTFEYHRLAGALLAGKRPVMLINDCCDAMAAVKEFESRGVSRERVSLIAAAEAGETTSLGLVRMTLNSWRQNRPNRLGPELRWGAKLDRFFFPKSADRT